VAVGGVRYGVAAGVRYQYNRPSERPPGASPPPKRPSFRVARGARARVGRFALRRCRELLPRMCVPGDPGQVRSGRSREAVAPAGIYT